MLRNNCAHCDETSKLTQRKVFGGINMNISLSVIGLVIAIIALALLVLKGINIYISAIIASSIALVFSGMPLGTSLVATYSAGFASFISGFFFRYLWGTIFGVLMEKCGAAKSVAHGIVRLFGKKYSVFGIVLANALLSYAAMVPFFVMLPIMVHVFKEANYPRRYIPSLLAFGCGTFANCMPGSAMNLNIISMKSVGLAAGDGFVIGMLGSIVVFIAGMAFFYIALNHALANGEGFDVRPTDAVDFRQGDEALPPFIQAIIPIIVVVVAQNFKWNGSTLVSMETAVFLGCVAAIVIMFKYMQLSKVMSYMSEGAGKTVAILGSVSAMTGFGAVMMSTPAYAAVQEFVTTVDLSPYVSLAIAMNIICACTGSATGAVGVVGPSLGTAFLGKGLPPVAVGRVMAVSGTCFDSVPQNGTIAMIIGDMCHETYKSAYPMVFMLNVVAPICGTIAVIIACSVIY